MDERDEEARPWTPDQTSVDQAQQLLATPSRQEILRTIQFFVIAIAGGAVLGGTFGLFAGNGDGAALVVGGVVGGIVGCVLSPVFIFMLRGKDPILSAIGVFGSTLVATSIVGVLFEMAYAFMASVFAFIASCIVVAIKLPTVWPAAQPWKCAGCGYDLRGLPTNTCPECGVIQPPRNSDDENSRAHPKSMCLARYCAACNEDLNWITSPRCINCGALRSTTDAEAEESSTKPRPPAADAPDSIT